MINQTTAFIENAFPATAGRIDKWYRRTEKEICSLPLYKARLANLESLLLELYPSFTWPLNTIGITKQGSHGDITQAYVIQRRLLEEESAHLKQRIKRIEASLAALTIEEKEIADLIYPHRPPWSAICRQLHISRSTYFERKNNLVWKLAICLGFISEIETRGRTKSGLNPDS